MSISIGDRFEFPSVKNQAEREVASFRKSVIYVYPADLTPGCTIEAQDFAAHYEEFKKLGYEVYGVSPSSKASHLRFKDEYALPFSLLLDTEKELIRYLGAYGEKKTLGVFKPGVLRSTFIINEEGILVYREISSKPKEAASHALAFLSE